jgi:2-dehydro-3-deoxyphosphogluconate aldolase/(4S)-4-hydroxy-2-oxoglutarate aldolase
LSVIYAFQQTKHNIKIHDSDMHILSNQNSLGDKMNRTNQIRIIEDSGIIAIIRSDSSKQLVEAAQAIAAGGIKVIEFTMTNPNALAILETAAGKFGNDILLGAGTVLDSETARGAILSGAHFIVAPTLNPSVIEICHRYSAVCIPGAYTPTEILTAWELGADFVKVFPADVLGETYIKAVLAPLPQIKLIPVGGVSLENISGYFKAGAVAVAVASNLVNKELILSHRFDELRDLARIYFDKVQSSRK